MVAVQEGRQDEVADIVRLLLAAGADSNEQNQNGMTALMCSAERGFLDGVKALLDADVDVNMSDSQGRTALALACEQGNRETVRTLLAAGADVNVQDTNSGFTALMHATREWTPVRDQFVLIAGWLILSGADVNIKNKEGKTALTVAQSTGWEELFRMAVVSRKSYELRNNEIFFVLKNNVSLPCEIIDVVARYEIEDDCVMLQERLGNWHKKAEARALKIPILTQHVQVFLQEIQGLVGLVLDYESEDFAKTKLRLRWEEK